MWRRLFSSNVRDPKEATQELKRHVRRLYKHIHPDRLGQFPKHRAVNEASFQVLQDALERHFDRVEARIKDIPPQAPRGSQQLTFYAHSSSERPQCPAKDSLKKAVVRFHESNLGNALQSLFESLGLEPPPLSILPGRGKGSTGQEFSSLTELVRHARHVIMTNVKKQHTGSTRSVNVDTGIDDEVLVTKLALQRSRGVNIVLGPGLPGKERLVLIFRRLARTMAGLRNLDLRNLVVEVDGGFEVALHSEGVYPWIILGACASGETWSQALSSQEVNRACQKSRHQTDHLRHLEAKAAIALGVKMVLHNVLLLEVQSNGSENEKPNPNTDGKQFRTMLRASKTLLEYEKMLEALLEATARANLGRDSQKTDSVVLMIEEGAGSSTEPSEGVIRVGLREGSDGVIRALQDHGAGVDGHFRRLRTAKDREEKQVANVKRALGIGGLRRGEGVCDRDWAEALARMRADAGRLRGVLDGVPVIVGTQARLLAESGEIEIPFDFYRSIRL